MTTAAAHRRPRARDGAPPLRIWGIDELDLHWYCSRGQSAFEGSTFGAQLEHAAAFRFDEDGEEIQSITSVREAIWRACDSATANGDDLPAQTQLIPLPSHEGSEPGYLPNEGELRRYARISRTLGRCSVPARRILAAFYGLRGDHWERTDAGRLLVLYPLTEAGAKVLNRLSEPPEGIRPDDECFTLWELQRLHPQKERGAKLRVMEEQARELLSRAQARYVEAKMAGAKRRPAPEAEPGPVPAAVPLTRWEQAIRDVLSRHPHLAPHDPPGNGGSR